jgi:stage V sporulation protein G
MKVNAKITKIIDKPDSSIKAFASVTLDGYFAVHGIKVCDGEKGLFVSMPSTSYTSNNETKYRDTFHPITKGAREALSQAVLDKYDEALSQSQDEGIEIQDLPEDEEEDESEELEEPEPEMSM